MTILPITSLFTAVFAIGLVALSVPGVAGPALGLVTSSIGAAQVFFTTAIMVVGSAIVTLRMLPGGAAYLPNWLRSGWWGR